MRNLKLTLAYDGTEFHGWQVQPELATIQGEIERALGGIEGRRVSVNGSGRTDAGVHALRQVASVALENPIPTLNLRRAMNRLLPPSIRVLEAEEAPADFHARFSARAKLYEYRLWRAEICPPMLYRYVCHHPYPLRLEPMVEAALLFEGAHDFRNFAATGPPEERSGEEKSPTVRTIFSSRFELDGDLLLYRVRGSGFLHHMVRNMVGTLLEVGKGNLAPADIPRLLAGADRSSPKQPRAGPTAAAQGLFLVQVEY